MITTGKLTGRALAISCMMFISSCGFQLRGAVDLPAGIEPIAVVATNNDSFANTLSNLLRAYGVKLSDNNAAANHLLVITELNQAKRSTALGEGARVAEYQLSETVTFELRDKQGKTVFGPNTISERKIVPNDPNKVVSTGEEEKILRREMLQNLAAKITRQLQSYDYQQ